MDTEFLNQLTHVLSNAASPSNEVQLKVMKAVDEMSSRPDFCDALGYILANPTSAAIEIRQRAGLLLKTAITRVPCGNQTSGVRELALRSISDPELVIRKTGSSIITTLVTTSPSLPCSDVLEALSGMLTSDSVALAAGAYDAVLKICEDLIELWRQSSIDKAPESGESPKILLDDFLRFSECKLIPLIFTLQSAANKIKLLNLFASNFLFFPKHPLERHLIPYFQCLGQMAATERAPETVGEVCKGLVYIARHHPDMYAGSLAAVLQFMLNASRSPEYSVRLDALHFWPVAMTNGDWVPQIQPALAELLPVLLDNMVYSQEDYLNMDEAILTEDNATVPDRPEDMAPRFHKEKENEDESFSDDGEEDNSTWGTEWTVRKSAASALDHIATAYRDSILTIMLPLVESRLTSESWEVQESALLALGAIGHGCMQGLSPHLPSILELLVSLSKSRKPLLRSISCWTISRFAAWISFDLHRPTALPLALSVILARMLDQNKRVQEAAVSAFVSLEEEVGMYMSDYIGDIVKTICASMSYYQSKNLLILLDAVACLFESLGPETMSKPEIIEALVPPVVNAFNRVNILGEKQLAVSLFECLTAIVTCAGPSIGMEHLTAAISRAGSVVELSIGAFARITNAMSKEEKPDGDILACALDLLCGVLDGMSNASMNIVSEMNFVPLVCHLILQFDPDSRLPLVRNYYPSSVKQCAFALLGDIAKSCISLLPDDQLAMMIPRVVAYVTIGPMLVSNNSSWALGELCIRKGSQFLEPFVDSITLALMSNLQRFEAGVRPIVRQNAAIALGRLGLVVAPRLVQSGAFSQMFIPWCTIMKKMRTDGEKLTAVKGFTLCVEASPSTVMTRDNLQALFELIASMVPPPTTLEGTLKGIVSDLRRMMGQSDWCALWSILSVEVQYRLNHAYSLGMEIVNPPPPPA